MWSLWQSFGDPCDLGITATCAPLKSALQAQLTPLPRSSLASLLLSFLPYLSVCLYVCLSACLPFSCTHETWPLPLSLSPFPNKLPALQKKINLREVGSIWVHGCLRVQSIMAWKVYHNKRVEAEEARLWGCLITSQIVKEKGPEAGPYYKPQGLPSPSPLLRNPFPLATIPPPKCCGLPKQHQHLGPNIWPCKEHLYLSPRSFPVGSLKRVYI